MIKKIALIISCEHAVNDVPGPYKSIFTPFAELLETHRGIDFGALTIAKHLNGAIPSHLVQAHATRLLVDCNRSTQHPKCFSEITKSLPPIEKQKIMEQYYLPFRQQVTNFIKDHIHQGFQVWHFSIHSFTPIMNNIIRNADIAFLYDPHRPTEKLLAQQWRLAIKYQQPAYKVRMNYPYNGISDGFTSSMRKEFPDRDYIGIEVESNQTLTQNVQSLVSLKDILATSLLKVKHDILMLS